MIRSKDIIEKARTYIGIPYSWGGNTPQSGFDCSGLVNYVFNSFGINVGRTTYQQITKGKKITRREDLRAGDLIFFLNKNGSPYHVVIYSGNNMMIEAPRTGLKVRERNLYRWNGIAVRIIKNPDFSVPQLPKDKTTTINKKVFFRVICGSFNDKQKALRRKAELKAYGLDSFLFAYKNGSKTFFRISCGSFNNRYLANKRVSILKSKKFDSFLLAFKK